MITKSLNIMNNLVQNYEIILKRLRAHNLSENFHLQRRKPKLSDLEVAALAMTAEYMSISSELQLFRVIKGTCLQDKIERTVFNKRRRYLKPFFEHIQRTVAQSMSKSQTYIIDSKPVEICKISRARRSEICSTEEIRPAFGWVSSTKRHYYGYKLHLVCDSDGIIHSFDLTAANVHDVRYLTDVKHNLSDCTVLGDRGYISACFQQDLFTRSHITLSVPMRENQHNYQPYCKIKRRIRKRIETLFSQMDAQFTMAINYAKTIWGLYARILSKITAITIIQNINIKELNNNLNNLKVNLTQ